MEIKPFYFGFDGLDVSFQGRIPRGLVEVLEAAKLEAQATRAPALVMWRGQSMHVAETGARGGYAFRCDTGPEGAVWFFASNEDPKNWNIRVSARSAWLAIKGYKAVRDGMYEFLEAIGADVLQESIARVDFCMDFRGDDLGDFSLDPTAFVMHSHTNRADHAEDVAIHGVSGRYTSVTCGKMPGRQVIVYDKTKEIVSHRKDEWRLIWAEALNRAGLPPLGEGEKVHRVEVRAGKDHLKTRWGCSTWAELEAMAGDVLGRALADIRYTTPSATDSERSRWPDAPIWAGARACVAGALFDWHSGVLPGVVKAVRRDQLAQTMRAMMLGLLATWTFATATPAKAEEVAPALAEMAQGYMQSEPDEFAAKLKRAGRKYRFLNMEGEVEGVVGKRSQHVGTGGEIAADFDPEGDCGHALDAHHGQRYGQPYPQA